MFAPNKYTKWYFSICDKAKNNVYDTVERHHIIPRSLGGDNASENIVSVSPREHFILHMLLVRMTNGKDLSNMRYALLLMSSLSKRQLLSRTYKVNSHVYDFLKRVKIPRGPMSQEQKDKISATLTGFRHTQQSKDKISKNHRRNQTEDTSNKISKSKKGIATRGTGWSTSDATKQKQKLSNTGKKRTDETRLNISKAQLGTKIVNNGSENKRVSKEEFIYYCKNGWIPGRIKFHYINFISSEQFCL